MSVAYELRRIEFRRSCGAKQKHASRGKAEAHVRSHFRRFGVLLVVYRCAWGHWHVGHPKKEQTR